MYFGNWLKCILYARNLVYRSKVCTIAQLRIVKNLKSKKMLPSRKWFYCIVGKALPYLILILT